jgi:hypothetical protein
MLQLIVLWALMGNAQAAPTIDVDGWCPAVSFTMTGATANREVMIVTGDVGGTTTLTRGPCAGTTLDLGDADARLNHVVTARTDSSGDLTFTPESLGRDACAKGVQGLDLTTCEVTSAVPMGIDCSATDLDDGLLAYWPGNGNARDVVGRHDGTIEGTVEYDAGVFGDAFEFDGWSAVKVRPYRDLDFDDGDSFTYAMWVYDEGVQPYHLFGKRHACGPGSSFDYQFVVQSNHMYAGSYTCSASVSDVPAASAWQHIVVSFDGSDWSIYVDGELKSTDGTCGGDDIPVWAAS